MNRLLLIVLLALAGCTRTPKVGEVYVFLDVSKENKPPHDLAIHIYRITKVENGELHWSYQYCAIGSMTNAPDTYPGGWGTVKNFTGRNKRFHTYLLPVDE